MPDDCSAYAHSAFFSPLIRDYLLEKEAVRDLYNRFPSLENFKAQLEEKASNYPFAYREILANALTEQYQNCQADAATVKNIACLREKNTFTITTGHQLNIGTGPLYFIYKIFSTINLCKQLQETYPDNQFVPVYWMATEDHDLVEINHLVVKNKKVVWQKEGAGAVGRLSTEGMEAVINEIKNLLGNTAGATELIELFSNSYLTSTTLADATRKLVNALFGSYGLVIVDGDDPILKSLFIPQLHAELHTQFSAAAVRETITKMQVYKIQVNPREINLFYLDEQLRERIILENGRYKVLNTTLEFSAEELQKLVQDQPEKFSPNVLLRPLYQEVILPNLCYIGGGGELAYWLELKALFAKAQISFPMVLLRNSVVIASEKTKVKLAKTPLVWEDLFKTPDEIIRLYLAKTTTPTLDFTKLNQQLVQQFSYLHQQAAVTHPSFLSMLKAQETKQLKGLAAMEKRFYRAEVKTNQERINQLLAIQNEVFPNQKLLERTTNFADYYSVYGRLFLEKLSQKLDPLDPKFTSLFLD